MAELQNARIDELPQSAGPQPGFFLAMRNMITGVTERVEVDYFLTSTISGDFEWLTDTAYLTDQVVTRGGKWWQALQDNTNVVPGTDPLTWTELSKSPSGFVEYEPGVFAEDQIYVLHNLDNYKQLFYLSNLTRPFVSANLLEEFAKGDWQLASERGYFAIEKVAHGFTMFQIITFKGGTWDVYTTGDKALGIVINIPTADTFIIYLLAQDQIQSVGSLTPGQIYYAQSDGSIGTTVTSVPLFFAVASSRAITLPQGGGGGPVDAYTKAEADYRFDGRSTGLLEGAVLSINADPTKFDISAGIAVYSVITGTDGRKTPVISNSIFAAKTALTVTNLGSAIATWVGLQYLSGSDVTVVQQTTPFTETQRRTIIEIGVLVHSNLTNLNAVNNFPLHLNNVHSSFVDLLKALGGSGGMINMEGNVYNHDGANLNLIKSAGKIFKLGSNLAASYLNPNTVSLASANPVTFRYRLQDSTEYADRTTIDPNNYDLAGVLTEVPVNKWTVQRVTLFQSGLTRIQYGQIIYNTYDEAVRSIFTEEFVQEPNIAGNGLLRCFVVVKQGATNLQDQTTANFIPASKLGEAGGGGGSGSGGSVPSVISAGLAGATSLNLAEGDDWLLTQTANATLDFTNAVVGKEYTFRIYRETTNFTFALATGKWDVPMGSLGIPVLTNPTTNGTSAPPRSLDIITAKCYVANKLTYGGMIPDIKNI